MEKIDEVFNELNKSAEVQNKLRDELYKCKQELEEAESKYFISKSKVESSLFDIVALVKTYNDSDKELSDIAAFLISYDGLELDKLCAKLIKSDMTVLNITNICDTLIPVILCMIPEAFLRIDRSSTVYIPKYAMLDIDVRTAQAYDIVDHASRMIACLETLHSYLTGLYVHKGGSVEYYEDLLSVN